MFVNSDGKDVFEGIFESGELEGFGRQIGVKNSNGVLYVSEGMFRNG